MIEIEKIFNEAIKEKERLRKIQEVNPWLKTTH